MNSGPDLQTLLALFPPTDYVRAWEFVRGELVPEPYHQLLVHEHHMTVTVEAHHGSLVDVRILDRRHDRDAYARKILLALHTSGKIVQFGIVRIHLQYCSPPVRAAIIAGHTPLGRILIDHNVLRRIEPTAFLRITPGPAMMAWFGLSEPTPTYGRLALIHCDNEPAIELLEIVALPPELSTRNICHWPAPSIPCGALLVPSSVPVSSTSLGPITRILVITIAAIGFLFDTYELLMFPVIGSDAVGELITVNKDGSSPGWLVELGIGSSGDTKRGIAPTSPPVRAWGGRMLWIAALSGGVFGLLGGLLIDRLGRKTIMIASILAYSTSPLAAAFRMDLWQLVLFRCTTFIGVCVEMVAAVTWLAELFEDKRTRELVIGWTLATASLGGILVTEAYNEIVEAARLGMLPAIAFPAGHNPDNVAWRCTLLTGLIPGAAILLLMPFVPESSVWK